MPPPQSLDKIWNISTKKKTYKNIVNGSLFVGVWLPVKFLGWEINLRVYS